MSTAVLIFGDSPFSESVAQKATAKGATVYYATPVAPASFKNITVLTTSFKSHDSINQAFATVFDAKHTRISIVAAFVPPPPSPGIPGADQAALDAVVDPLIRATKVALWYFRRYDKIARRQVFLGIDGKDPMTKAARGSVLGLFRSQLERFEVIDVLSDFVEVEDLSQTNAQVAADTVVRAATDSSLKDAHVWTVRGGVATQKNREVGMVLGSQYTLLQARFKRILRSQERITRLKNLSEGKGASFPYILFFAPIRLLVWLVSVIHGVGNNKAPVARKLKQ
ncbi:uncharacterized protein LOC62_04G006013 [Vanrija pseudolonga]|uniref:Uncharacterized protein n=1 Tax=Vanrija pseudolonga TaxID=143232 RepID=A0AAF1BRR4_9TREE|nr:hypothetical protein LOC62_04G006013 [Vanrija pseudolonga]